MIGITILKIISLLQIWKTLNNFLEELNKVKPLPREQNSDPISNSRNNEDFRELTVNLNDGSRVRLTLLKDGYIYYGFMDVYFEMNEGVFSKMWSKLLNSTGLVGKKEILL